MYPYGAAGTVTPKQADVVQNKSLPTLAIVSTGGTIASRIDYRTGSVTSQFNANDILTAIPDLRRSPITARSRLPRSSRRT